MWSRFITLVTLVVAAIASSATARAQCTTWETGPGNPGLNAPVWSMVSFDDGSGPSLFAGGTFTTAGGAPIGFVGRWDGVAWHDLAGGMNGPVFSLCVYDDGNGPALYAGGRFSLAGNVAASSIAKWDGANWSALGAGVVGCNFSSCRVVLAMAAHDDGSGDALFVAGDFNTAGGQPANRIAKWQAGAWTTLGSGLGKNVNALTVFDDGSGPALYAGGAFTNAGGVPSNYVARWKGGAWSATPGLFGNSSTNVRTFVVFDDGTGTGPALFLGGEAIASLSKWNGTAWAPSPPMPLTKLRRCRRMRRSAKMRTSRRSEVAATCIVSPTLEEAYDGPRHAGENFVPLSRVYVLTSSDLSRATSSSAVRASRVTGRCLRIC